MEDVILGDEREIQQRIVLEDNERGRYNKKYLLHYERWDIYVSDKNN